MTYTTIALILICILLPTCLSAAAPPQVTSDIVYARVGGRDLHLNLTVLAVQPSKPRPAVIWVHGGGWNAGDYHDSFAGAFGLTEMGYVTGSIEYRLSQEAKYPAQIHDCKAAIRFLRANAGKYGIDPNRIGVWGGSAGGHLVALLGTTGGIKALEGDEGNLGYSSRVQAVCDLFGPTDFSESGIKEFLPVIATLLDQLLGGLARNNKGLARLASPVEFVSKDDPPFLILHGDEDPLVPLSQSETLYNALKRVGADVKLVKVKHAGHGFGEKENEPSFAEIKKMVQEFFREKLGGGK